MPTIETGNTCESSPSTAGDYLGNPPIVAKEDNRKTMGQFKLDRPLTRVPSLSETDGINIDVSLYNHINQDILTMKTNLLKLKRILQEAEVGNSIESEVKPESLYACLVAAEAKQLNLAAAAAQNLVPKVIAPRHQQIQSQPPHSPCEKSTVSPIEENQDLKRQLIFLHQQMEDKDRRIRTLEALLNHKTSDTPPYTIHSAPITPSMAMANTATQTERSRPVSCGGNITHTTTSCEQGGFISSNSDSSSINGINQAFHTISPIPPRSSRQVDKTPKLHISNRKISDCDRGRSPSGGRHTAKRAESPRVSEKTTARKRNLHITESSSVSRNDAGFTSRSDASIGLRKVSAPNSSSTSRNKYLPRKLPSKQYDARKPFYT